MIFWKKVITISEAKFKFEKARVYFGDGVVFDVLNTYSYLSFFGRVYVISYKDNKN